MYKIIGMSFIFTFLVLFVEAAPTRALHQEDNSVADRRENLYEYNLYDRTQNKNLQNQYYYYQDSKNNSYNSYQNRPNNRNYYFNPRVDD